MVALADAPLWIFPWQEKIWHAFLNRLTDQGKSQVNILTERKGFGTENLPLLYTGMLFDRRVFL